MKKIEIFRLLMYLVSVAIPVLAIYNCTGWSTSDMQVSSCYIDFVFCRTLANFFINWLFISAFLFGIPIIIYFAIFIGLIEFIVYAMKKDTNNIDTIKKDNKS